MNIYDIWVDGNGKHHKIEEMPTSYIQSCVVQIKKAADSWRCISYDSLTEEELRVSHMPMQKAWFVIHAREYLNSFCNELEARCEETNIVEQVIAYVQ